MTLAMVKIIGFEFDNHFEMSFSPFHLPLLMMYMPDVANIAATMYFQ